MDEFKRAFSSVFTRDLRLVDPSKKGLIVGEDLRVYDEPTGAVIRFLRGTPTRRRHDVQERLDGQNVTYSIGDDFEN